MENGVNHWTTKMSQEPIQALQSQQQHTHVDKPSRQSRKEQLRMPGEGDTQVVNIKKNYVKVMWAE